MARRAVAEAEKHVGRAVERDRVWVIGDTPHDVACARAINAKAVAVGTGWHSMEELNASNPDYAVKDLTVAKELFAEWGLD